MAKTKKMPPEVLSLLQSVHEAKVEIETERKFRLSPETFAAQVAKAQDLKKISILQGWFKHDDGEQSKTYRVRQISSKEGVRYVLEYKSRLEDLEYSKEEFPIEISAKQFLECIGLCKWFITKDRYLFVDENMGEVVVDVYLGREDIILEKEFPDDPYEEKARRYKAADWCGEEVTHKFSSKWAAKELAKESFSSNPEE